MKRAQVVYSGNVQGVGFRYTAVNLARGFAVTGWVRNCPGSQVEVVAEGEAAEVKKFLNAIKAEMSSFVRDEKISWEPASGEFTCFQTRY